MVVVYPYITVTQSGLEQFAEAVARIGLDLPGKIRTQPKSSNITPELKQPFSLNGSL